MTGKRSVSTRVWIIALAVLFAAAIAAALLIERYDGSARVVRVYQDGALIRQIDLSAVDAPYDFTIEYAGGYNTISVRSGGICVSSADCSDGTCMKQGWLKGGITPIICLPHKLVIQFEDTGEETPAKETEFDAVAG